MHFDRRMLLCGITLEGQGNGLLQLLELFGEAEVSLGCRSGIRSDVSLTEGAWARHDCK